jgi:hypothetical protein
LSLPAAQERALERIAEALRSSEPRLASMFAIFTRLTQNESRPRREQLPSAVPAWLMWLTVTTRRLPGGQNERGRRCWRQTLILTPVAIVVGLLLALTGIYLHSSRACSAGQPRSTLVATARHSCPVSGVYPSGK